MRLNRRLQKALAVAALATVTVTALPTTTFASDYENHWAKVMIDKWSEKEVLKGYEDGNFKPNDAVTRGQLAAILVRVFGLNEVADVPTYTDVLATKWYAGDVAKVSVAGLMNVYEDGTFKPEQQATREEAAYAIAKAYHVAAQDKLSNFTDQAQISDWAEEEIAALVAGGYLDGNPDGSFRPQATLTRAQAVTMIDKITADLVNVEGIYSQDIKGNLVVNTANVELKDMTITGNLYLAEGIGEGDVKLTNVTVLGDVIVEGGSVNTIKVEGKSKLHNILVDKAGKKPVRLLFSDLVEVNGKVTLESPSTLEGSTLALKEVIVNDAKEVSLVGGMKIDNLTVNQTIKLVLADGPTIQLVVINKDATGTLLEGKGTKGSIQKMTINASNVELKEGFKYDKNTITLGDGVTGMKLPQSSSSTSTDSSTGSTGNDSGNTGVTDKKLHIHKVIVKLLGEATPVEISTTYNGKANTIHAVVDTKANTITLNGHTFTKDQQIESIKVMEEANLAQVKVFLAGILSQVIDTNQTYNVGDLATMVSAKEDGLLKLLEVFKTSLGDQYTTVTTLLTNGIADLNTYAENNTGVSVEYMLGRAERVRHTLAQASAKEVYESIQNTLKLAGITATDIGTPTPSIKGKLSVAATKTGYEVDTINVTVTYK